MRARAAFLAICLAGAAGAADYTGQYALTDGSDCSAGSIDDPNGALVIAGDLFQGVESSCRMTLPVDVIGMDATLFTFECTGEGLTWDMRAMIMRAAQGGIFVIRDGFAFHYPDCPAG